MCFGQTLRLIASVTVSSCNRRRPSSSSEQCMCYALLVFVSIFWNNAHFRQKATCIYTHIAVVSILDSRCLLQQWRCVDTQHAVKKIAIGSTCQWCLSELWRVCKKDSWKRSNDFHLVHPSWSTGDNQDLT